VWRFAYVAGGKAFADEAALDHWHRKELVADQEMRALAFAIEPVARAAGVTKRSIRRMARRGGLDGGRRGVKRALGRGGALLRAPIKRARAFA